MYTAHAVIEGLQPLTRIWIGRLTSDAQDADNFLSISLHVHDNFTAHLCGGLLYAYTHVHTVLPVAHPHNICLAVVYIGLYDYARLAYCVCSQKHAAPTTGS